MDAKQQLIPLLATASPGWHVVHGQVLLIT